MFPAGDITATKVLQFSFIGPLYIKIAQPCDVCQRADNVSRIYGVPMNYTLPLEPFDISSFDFMGSFPESIKYTHILVALHYATKHAEEIPT
jgi:hypothetical protein